MKINIDLIKISDITGAIMTIILVCISLIICIKMVIKDRDNIINHYFLFITTSFLFFSLSRGVSHILKYIIQDYLGKEKLWDYIAPYTGSFNTISFIIIFSFSLFFYFFQKINHRIEILNLELKEQAITDSLTGLYNRRELYRRLQEEIGRAKRVENYTFSLIMGDIDYFKRFNDYYGHLEGDKCLKQIAHILKSNANRVSDITARYGGEEFVILLPGVNLINTKKIAESINNSIYNMHIEHKKSKIKSIVTISMGLVEYNSSFNKVEEILEAVDINLYKAKKSGRNCYFWE